jgi:hypothetical protein
MDKPWKVVFAFVGVFIAGSVFGGFFALRIGGRVLQMENPALRARPLDQRNAQQQRPLLGGLQPVQAAQLMRRYAERLDLTPEQKEKINPLIQRATEDIRRQQQINLRENSIILQRLQQDLAKELTADQRVRLEKMEQRQQELRNQYGDRGNPGPRQPGREGARGFGGPGAPKQPPEGDAGKGMRPLPPVPPTGAGGK